MGQAIMLRVGSPFMMVIVIIKARGIALAVFLGATVARTLLVSADTRLLGRWNWWGPRKW